MNHWKHYAVAFVVLLVVGLGYAWTRPDPTRQYRVTVTEYTPTGQVASQYSITSPTKCAADWEAHRFVVTCTRETP